MNDHNNTEPPDDMFSKILLDHTELEEIVQRLAKELYQDYKDNEIPPVLIGILTGSAIFTADLARIIREAGLPFNMQFLTASSYKGKESTGSVALTPLFTMVDIWGRDIIIIEDIVDTGATLDEILKLLNKMNPSSLRVCSLLSKPSRRLKEFSLLNIDYLGNEVPDVFVVGYGIDIDGWLRGLPFVGVLSSSGEEWIRGLVAKTNK